jgi:hypothetical protein
MACIGTALHFYFYCEGGGIYIRVLYRSFTTYGYINDTDYTDVSILYTGFSRKVCNISKSTDTESVSQSPRSHGSVKVR